MESIKKAPKKFTNTFNVAKNSLFEISQWVNTALHIPFEQRMESCPEVLKDENIHLFGMIIGLISLAVECFKDRSNMKQILRARRFQVLATFCHFWVSERLCTESNFNFEIWGQTQWGEDVFPCVQSQALAYK